VPRLGLEGDVAIQLTEISPIEYTTNDGKHLRLFETIKVKISISFENFRKKIEISYVE